MEPVSSHIVGVNVSYVKEHVNILGRKYSKFYIFVTNKGTILLNVDVDCQAPNVMELTVLLEKEEEVLSVLHDELEVYKLAVSIPRARSLKRMDHKRPTELKNTGFEHGQVTRFISHKNEKSMIKNLSVELKKKVVEVENLVQKLEAKEIELSNAVHANTLKQRHIDYLVGAMAKERDTMNDKLLTLNNLLVQKTLECDQLNSEDKASKTIVLTVTDESNANVTKEKLVNDFMENVTKELSKRNEEEKSLASRLSILVDENDTLRSSLITLGAAELSPQCKKLLEQQHNFIETLKSEWEILTHRLMKERAEHRKERKILKRQVHDLNLRLELFISGKQDLANT
ncbi:unnamed protein product [Thelazia callipaeda]|uniref:Coiled-coil domain-containing protein 150 n=1 Tax=Thelazia callipaeda TaxID=103827 RepID=A0A0N5D638_THECL|nr:unnamed protein product [Thelazia callipaeda]